MSQKTEFPRGWDEERVRRVLEHYESQSEIAAVAEDETAYEVPNQVFMEVPADLVPEVRRLIASRKAS